MSDSKALILNSSGNLQEVFVDSFDKPAISIASAASIDLYNVTSNTINITGTTTITSFGTPPVDGVKRLVQFIGSLTLTHGTSSGSIRLPGLANITTSLGDMAEFISSGGVWICYNYTKLNGQSVVGGGSSDDGVTFSNLCDLAMDGTTVINDLKNFYYKPNVGFAQLYTTGVPISGNYVQFGSLTGGTNISGTGALAVFALIGAQAVTGTTATGYARLAQVTATELAALGYNPYVLTKSNTLVDRKMAASAVVHLSALSDATNTYTALLTLLGEGPGTNTAVSATSAGIHLEYTHSVNSGNWVIKYRGADGLLKTVNTTIAPATTLATAQRIIVKAHRTGVGTSTITVSIAGTVYTITDSAFGAGDTYTRPGFQIRMIKSAGTTSATLFARHISAASNLP